MTTIFLTQTISMEVLMTLFRFLEMVAGVLVSGGVVWKFFGKYIKNFITDLAIAARTETDEKLTKDIEKVMEELLKLSNRLDKQEEKDMVVMGYSILRACKESLQLGKINEMEYSQLDRMYKMYKDELHGNGVVEKIWTRFKEEVEVV